MIACFLSNISAKYYKNPSMFSRVIAKNVGDVFFETQCRYRNPVGLRRVITLSALFDDFSKTAAFQFTEDNIESSTCMHPWNVQKTQ